MPTSFSPAIFLVSYRWMSTSASFMICDDLLGQPLLHYSFYWFATPQRSVILSQPLSLHRFHPSVSLPSPLIDPFQAALGIDSPPPLCHWTTSCWSASSHSVYPVSVRHTSRIPYQPPFIIPFCPSTFLEFCSPCQPVPGYWMVTHCFLASLYKFATLV